VWDSTVAHFKGVYECHVLTLAGFAGQPPLPAGTPLLATVRTQLAAYISDRKLKSPVIVGHSLGGFLALWLGAEHPKLTGPLVIVDSLPFLPAAYMADATVESVKDQANAMRTMTSALQGDTWLKYQKSNPALQAMISDEANRAIAAEWGAKSDPATVGMAMFELFQTDLRPLLPNIQARTLVIAALKSYPESAIQNYQTQYAPLKNLTLAPAPEARHFVMFDAPAKMFETMEAFLKGSL
jgi:pimeloyl-ACP methyl ester carboxylesterase